MQLSEFWSALRRRWYLVLVAVLVAAGASVLAVYLVGPTYKAQSAVLMLPPGTTVQQATPGSADGNPYLSLGSVSQARDVVVRALTASTTHEELCRTTGSADYQTMLAGMCKSDPTVTYAATPDFTSSAPMVLITIEADTPRNAIVALQAVSDLVPGTLLRLQEDLNLRPRALITSTPVVMDETPKPAHKAQIRASIAAGAAALGLSLLAIGLVDGLLLSRRPRSPLEQFEGADPEDDDVVLQPRTEPDAASPVDDEASAPEDLPDWGWGGTNDDGDNPETADREGGAPDREDTEASEVEPDPVGGWAPR